MIQKLLFKFIIKKLLIFSLIAIFIALFFHNSFSQTQGDYKTVGSGNWSAVGIWQKYDTVTSWQSAASPPTGSNNAITITFGTTVSLDVGLSLDQLIIGGTLSLNSGQSLNIFNGTGVDLIVGGTINGAGNININSGAVMEFQNGTVTGTGGVNIANGGALNITTSTVTFDRNVTNDGTINWSSGAINGSGTITNNSVFNNQTNFGGSLNTVFINNGTFNKTTNNQNTVSGNFQNPGTINITTGNITLNTSAGAAAFNGTVNISAAGILQFGNSGFTTYTVNALISGAGTVSCGTTAVNFSSSCTYNITGTTTAFSGTMTFSPGMTLTNVGNLSPAGGTIVLPAGLTVGAYGPLVKFTGGGTLTLNTGITFNFQKVTMNGGYLQGSDSLIISDSLTISTGQIQGAGAITLKPGSYCTVFNNSPTIDKSIINNGTINWTLGSIFGSGTLYNNSVINMTANAFSCFMPFVNAGTLNKSSSAISQISYNFTNLSTGVLNITAGAILTSAGGGTYNVAGNINVSSGALFQFGNSATATYNFTGTISGAGSFTGHTSTVNFLAGCVYNLSGNTSIQSGTTNFNSGMTLSNIGTMSSAGGTLNLQPGLIVSAVGSTLNITGGGVFNFNSGQKFQFTSISTNGTIAGSDTIVLNGNMAAGGTLSGTGPLNILSGSVMDINSALFNNKTINNAGTINWGQAGINGNGIINNNNIFNISPTLNFNCSSLINNFSNVNKGASASPVLSGGLNNFGTVNVTSGNLVLFPGSGSFTSSGLYNISASCGVSFGQSSGTSSYSITGTISGAGSVTFTAPTVTFGPSSVYNISGSTIASSGTVNFNSSMTLTNLGNLTVNGATLNFPSGTIIGSVGSNLNFSSGVINFNTGISKTFNQIDLGGTFGGTDTVYTNTTLNWTSGGFSNVGVLKSGGTATVNSNTVTLSGTFINNGTLNWTQLQFSGNGIFYNNNIFNINASNVYSFAPSLINNGTINKTTSNINTIIGTFTNNGTLNIQSGGISVGNGINLSPASIILSNNTTFAVNNGTFTTTGNMTIPSNSFINGNGFFNYNAPNLVNDGNISVMYIQFDSVTNISGSGAINVVNCYFLSGCVCALASNHQFKNITVYNGGTFNLNGLKASFNGTGTAITNNGTFNTNNSTIEYNGTSQQTISTTNIGYKNLTVNNITGASLTGTLNVNDTLYIQSGFLNINQNNIVLSSVGYLRENPGATVRGVNGTISTTRPLNAPNNLNVAGLGVTLTSISDLGTTTISRGHNIYTINGTGSIQRFYNISPANNSGLNATLTYHYDNSELNGLNKSFLSMYRSTNAGTNWTVQGGQKDTANNNITFSGISAFSYWTAANNPLAASINITSIVDALYNTSNNSLNKKDTLTIYLRNSSAPYAIVDSAKILVDSLTFSGTAFFNTTPSGTYYISVKYRNALEVWSKSGGESYSTGTFMSYDFTSSQSQSYGNSTILKNGKYCLISGDLNQDGFVNGNDFTLFSQQFAQTGYLRADLNGDNVVNGNDFTSFSASFGKQSLHP